MYCRSCGTELREGAIACTTCGVPPLSGSQFCGKCGSTTNPGAVVCVSCGSALTTQSTGATATNTGKILGITSIILGALTFGIQIIGGFCCGWIGWPLGIAAIICGIIAIVQGEKVLGIIGCVLSVLGVVLQLLIAFGLMGSLSHSVPNSVPNR